MAIPTALDQAGRGAISNAPLQAEERSRQAALCRRRLSRPELPLGMSPSAVL
jgi:hypothetical protein